MKKLTKKEMKNTKGGFLDRNYLDKKTDQMKKHSADYELKNWKGVFDFLD